MQPITDPKKLFYFATVVELGSFKKAAKQLAISQPALSMSMSRLEKSIGQKLLERSATGVVPTDLGELLCSHARLIKDEMKLVETRITRSARSGARGLTIGTLPSLATTIVPYAIGLWQKNHLNIQLRIIEEVQVQLLLGLQRGNFNFIVGQTGYYNVLDGMKQRVLFRDRLCIFARANHPVFDKPDASWADLVRFPWVLPMISGQQKNLLEKLVTSFNLQMPKQTIECGSIDFTRSLVAASDNLAMLPQHAVSSGLKDAKLRVVPVSDPALSRDIVVVFRDRAPPDKIGRELLGHIKTIGQQFSQQPEGFSDSNC